MRDLGYQRPIQSVNSFKSYRAKQTINRQTDTFAKTIFSGSEGLKTWTFDKKKAGGGGHILHKSNTFSDVNVKRKLNITYFLVFRLFRWITMDSKLKECKALSKQKTKTIEILHLHKI